MPHSTPHKKVKVQPLRFVKCNIYAVHYTDEDDLKREMRRRGGSLYAVGSNGLTIEIYPTTKNELAMSVQYEKRS